MSVETGLARVGRVVGTGARGFATGLGQVGTLVARTFRAAATGPVEWRMLVAQMIEMGNRSLPIVMLVAFFTGMVLALQAGYASRNWFGEPIFTGMIVGFSLVKELGPVLTAVVFAGRVGAAIAAEIGTMKVTEQLDALYTLGTSPVHYLAVPRLFAAILTMPFLAVFAAWVGIFGGALVSNLTLNIPTSVYQEEILNFMRLNDFAHGIIKAMIFAALVAVISIHKGFTCEGGAEGVGRATTSAVVLSIVLVLVSDYFLSTALMAVGIGAGEPG